MSRSEFLDPNWGGRRGRRGQAPMTEVTAELDAIDATLAGDPVDPAHAELAELALLLADTAPRPSDEFSRNLDRRVSRRFAVDAQAAATPLLRRRRWQLAGAGAVAVVAAAALAVVLVTSRSSTPPVVGPVVSPSTLDFHASSGGATSRAAASGVSSAGGSAVNSPAGAALTPAPSGGGSRRIQSAQITLTAPNARINLVAQEIFDVVGAEQGSVKNSQITTATTANGGSYASFTLSIPVGNLQSAMTRLSQLAHTSVTSRTDSSQNVSDQYSTDRRRIADAQALRDSLLKQLQAATTQNATNSLEKQIRDAEAQLTHDQTALKSLQHRITNSAVTVTVNSGRLPGPRPLAGHHSYLHRALHNALHVLVVAAGVALIAIAVAIPVAVLLALLVWLGLRLRRRGRERALDQA